MKKNIITTEYEVSDSFSGISVNLATADLSIAVTDGEAAMVRYDSAMQVTISSSVQDHTLSVTLAAGDKWYKRIFLRAPRVEIMLPKAAYEALSVKIKTGRVSICGISAKAIDASAATGEISVSDIFFDSNVKLSLKTGSIGTSNIRCRNLDANTTTGVITLDGVLIEKNLKLKTTAGTINLRGSDASTSSITASAGFINGNLLSYE